MEAGRGVTNAAHLAIALAIITAITSKRGSAAGLKGGIIFYSVVVIVLGILVLLFFKDPETSDKSERFNFKQVLTVMKLPQVWILCLILCCTYVMNMSYAYFNPYATSTLGVAMVGGTIVTIMADYIRPFASVGGGVLADRLGRPRICLLYTSGAEARDLRIRGPADLRYSGGHCKGLRPQVSLCGLRRGARRRQRLCHDGGCPAGGPKGALVPDSIF